MSKKTLLLFLVLVIIIVAGLTLAKRAKQDRPSASSSDTTQDTIEVIADDDVDKEEDDSEPTGRVDTHMHAVPTWMGKTDYEATADTLIGYMEGFGVDKIMIVTVPSKTGQDAEEDYEDARNVVSYYPDQLFHAAGGSILGQWMQGIDAEDVTVEEEEEFAAKANELIDEGAVAFGEMISLHMCLDETHSFQVVKANHPLFLVLSDVAAERGVPIDLHMEVTLEDMDTPDNLLAACNKNPETLEASLPALEELLEYNRDTEIVWQHVGWDNIGQMTPELMGSLLDEHSNLYFSMRVERREGMVGGGGPMPNRIVDRNGNLDPDWLEVIEAHPDRFMIGSDDFIGEEGAGVHGDIAAEGTWAMVDQLPSYLRSLVEYENAKRVYNLD